LKSFRAGASYFDDFIVFGQVAQNSGKFNFVHKFLSLNSKRFQVMMSDQSRFRAMESFDIFHIHPINFKPISLLFLN